MIVVDASVCMSWIATDERDDYADAVLRSCASDRVVVPGLWYWEMANALLVAERRGRLADAEITFETFVRRVPIESRVASDRVTVGRAELALSKRYALSVYDAAYLALAKSESLPLATLDRQLFRAAEREGVAFTINFPSPDTD